MNNLDYSICFRKEQYFCTQTYTVNTSDDISGNLNVEAFGISSPGIAPGIAGAGVNKCPNDYLLLNGIRFCGYRLNERAIKDNDIGTNAPVFDKGSEHMSYLYLKN